MERFRGLRGAASELHMSTRLTRTERGRFFAVCQPWICPAAGFVLCLLGAAGLAGWKFQILPLVVVQEGYAPMHPTSAIAFFLCGAALIGTHFRSRSLAICAGGLAASLGLLALAQYQFMWDLGLDEMLFHRFEGIAAHVPNRMSPVTAFCFLLSGIGICMVGSRAHSRRQLLVCTLMSIVLGIATATLVTYSNGKASLHGWGIPLSPMALHSALGFLILSLCVLAGPAVPAAGKEPLPDWIPIPVGMCAASVTIGLYLSVVSENRELRNEDARRFARNAARAVATAMDERLSALDRMGNRWRRRDGTPVEEWLEDARMYCDDFVGFQSILWIGPDYQVRAGVPAEEEGTSARSGALFAIRELAALESARDTQQLTLSQSVLLGGGKAGFIAYVPLVTSERFDGFIAAVFLSEPLFDSTLSKFDLGQSGLAIFQNGRLMFASPHYVQRASVPAHVEEFDLGNISWQLVFQPNLQGGGLTTDRIALLIGLLVSGLLAGIVYFAQSAVKRSRILNTVNAQLTEEIEKGSRAQQELVRLAAMHESILHSSPYSIISASPEGVITSFNPAAERLLGYSAEQVIGKMSLQDLHDRAELQEHAIRLSKRTGTHVRAGFPALTADLSEPGKEGHEWTYVRSDFTRVPVSVFITAMTSSSGEILGYLSMASDITERRKHEKELAKARDAALNAVKMKAQFLANMSHEIRTPMNGVIGMAQILQETPLNPEQRECVEVIQGSGEALLSVVNDILDFSKIEAGKLTIEKVEFDIRQVATTSLRQVMPAAHKKDLELLASFSPTTLCPLYGDPARLGQVMTNLLNNAVKFTETGEVHLMVKITRQGEASLRLRCEVRDTGIGLSEETIGRLFQPFVQAEESTTRQYGGTGLGLTICRQIMELMHGRIGVQSEPGKGSTFWFELDLEQASRVGPEDESKMKPTYPDTRVLLLEANQSARSILADQLQVLGVEVFDTGNVEIALEQIRNTQATQPYDLILLDSHLLGGSNLPLLRKVQSAASGEARIVLMTRAHDRYDSELLAHSSVVRCILKPITPIPLNTMLSELLKPKAARAIPSPTTMQSVNSSARILLAEDNKVNQIVTVNMLRKLGYHVDCAGDGTEVLEAHTARGYELILMDCQMPVMDGLEASRRIRQMEVETGRPRVRIIALTAGAMDSDHQACLAAGMDGYITKPVQLEQLKQAIEDGTGRQQTIPSGTS
jgi:PAS domain S-box-containing protein